MARIAAQIAGLSDLWLPAIIAYVSNLATVVASDASDVVVVGPLHVVCGIAAGSGAVGKADGIVWH